MSKYRGNFIIDTVEAEILATETPEQTERRRRRYETELIRDLDMALRHVDKAKSYEEQEAFKDGIHMLFEQLGRLTYLNIKNHSVQSAK